MVVDAGAVTAQVWPRSGPAPAPSAYVGAPCGCAEGTVLTCRGGYSGLSLLGPNEDKNVPCDFSDAETI